MEASSRFPVSDKCPGASTLYPVVALKIALCQYCWFFVQCLFAREAMRKSCLAMLVVAGMLAGCGGGGSSGGNSAPQLPAGPKTYSAAKASAGDYYVFKNLYREEGSNEQAYYSTRLVSNVAMNGTVSIKYLDDAQLSSSPQDMGSRNYSADFDALGRWLGSSNWRCGNSTNPPMYTVAPLTIAVGIIQGSARPSARMRRRCKRRSATRTTPSHWSW
jgi:hypothetical protein